MLNYIKHTYLMWLFLGLFAFGAKAQEISTKKDSSSVFSFKNTIREKVVSLYGPSVDRKYSTTSVSTISSREIRSLNAPTFSSSLAGKLTGLNVSQSGGDPGSSNSSLQIRGLQTFLSGAGDVKVLVDGFETDWNSLLPDEIESISVLKDAASLAQYGISGANGIVYIKTKRGQVRDKASITLNSRVSFQQPTIMPKFVNNGDYAELYNVAMVSDGKDIANGYFKTPEIVNYFKNGTSPVLYPDVNWYNEVLKPSTIAQDYTLAINGGKKNAIYNVVLGYTRTPGLYDNVDGTNNSNYQYNKYVARINLDTYITDWLRSEINARATFTTTKQPNVASGTLWTSMGSFLPYSVKTPSGNWGGTEGYAPNPVGQVQQQGYQIVNGRTIDAVVKLIADLPFVKGLSIFGQVVFSNNYFSYYNKNRGLSYEELFPVTAVPGSFISLMKGATSNNFSYSQPSGDQWNRVNMIAGLEYSHETKNGKLYASGMYLRQLYTTTFTISNVPWAKENFNGRVNYNHLGKYVAEFGYSYSGTDNYAPGNRFGFFPSLSAAWILSGEDILKGNKAIGLLKLRASSGLVGNDQIGTLPRFMFQENYGSPSGNYYVGNTLSTTSTTRELSSKSNPDATWEKAYKTNFGIDAEFFGKLNFSADYFFEKRTDIFVDPANNLSVVIGSRYNYMNEGSAKNSGAEIELMYKDRIGDIGFYLLGRTSYVKTEIVDSKEPPRAADYLYRKGHPIGQPFVLEAIGYFKDNAEIASSPFQSYGSVKPGDVKYKDQNQDNVIDDNDVMPLGHPDYPSLIYSFDAGIEFKGFDLSLFIQGVSGTTNSLLNQNEIVPFLNGNRKPTEWVKENYWTPERGNNALFPRLTTESNANNYRASTLWQRDGSYLRIKNIELGYSLAASTCKRFKIDGLRIYFNAVNPLTLSKINEIDVDPEINNPFKYPMMKSYNLGLTLNF
jgi:TonB-linked SusC/RagA family outer membrane protein